MQIHVAKNEQKHFPQTVAKSAMLIENTFWAHVLRNTRLNPVIMQEERKDFYAKQQFLRR